MGLKSSVSFLKTHFFTFPVVFLVFLVAITYIYLGRRATQNLIQQTHERELHLAISGANSVKSFIDLVGNSTVNLAKIISASDEDPKNHVISFGQNWEDSPVVGAILADAHGTVLYIETDNPDELTQQSSISDRDYFPWAQSAKPGEIFIGRPVKPRLGLYKDTYIVPVVSPVFKNNQFQGLVAAGISLTKLSEDYLNLLKFTDSTRIYLINSEGTILYSPFAQLQGVNYIDYLEKLKFPGSDYIKNDLRRRAENTETGKINIVLPDAKSLRLTSMLIAHAPILLKNQHWTLAVATPLSDAVAYIGPIYINQLGLLIAAFLILLLWGVRAAKKHAYQELQLLQKSKKSPSGL